MQQNDLCEVWFRMDTQIILIPFFLVCLPAFHLDCFPSSPSGRRAEGKEIKSERCYTEAGELDLIFLFLSFLTVRRKEFIKQILQEPCRLSNSTILFSLILELHMKIFDCTFSHKVVIVFVHLKEGCDPSSPPLYTWERFSQIQLD